MTKELDAYDYKILYELDGNSRESASNIAKKVRLSKVSVNQRIKRLFERGVVKNFTTQVNYRLLGYNTSRIYYKLQNIPANKEEEFFNFLCSLKSVGYVARIDGAWDVFSVILYKSNEEFDLILNKINKKYGHFIKERNILTVLNIIYFGRRYLSKIKEEEVTTPIIRKKPENPIEIDKIDHRILQNLSLNSRIQVTELMEKLNLSKDILHYRLKKLIKENAIQGFTINLNHEKFGNSFFKLLIKFNYNFDEKLFISKISSSNNLFRIIRLLGNWDLELDFEVKDNREMRQIIKKIKEEVGPYIQNEDLLFVYQIDKLNFYPF